MAEFRTAEARVELTGRERERLRDALLRTFDSRELERLVSDRFNPVPGTSEFAGRLSNFATGDDETRTDALIGRFERRGWIVSLVEEAHRAVPGNPYLRAVRDEFATSLQRQVSGRELERIVVATSPFLDTQSWRELFAARETAVCKIHVGRTAGTGFLVGRDIVLTNYHVLEPALTGRVPGADVTLTFDYKVKPDGSDLESARVARLANDWTLACSPPSAADRIENPKDRHPSADELDFALVRLSEAIGDDTMNGGRRGWVDATLDVPLEADRYLAILQHPRGVPMKLAFETRSIIAVNPGATRVSYRTNTEPGSSGSPCFDENWQLVALHHSGDPRFSRPASYNEGIPIATIRTSLPEPVRACLVAPRR